MNATHASQTSSSRPTSLSNKDIRFAVGSPIGSAPLKILCPFHQEDTPSFAVYEDGAKCFGCGAYLTAEQFLEHYRVSPENLPVRGTTGNRIREFRFNEHDTMTQIMVWHQCLTKGPRRDRLQWFLDRGFRRATVDRYMFGHDGDNFIIPIWDRGTLIGYKRRRDPRFCDDLLIQRSKYVNMRGLPNTLIRPNPEGMHLIICEGELDAYLVAQYGYDTLTVTSGADALGEELARHQWIHALAPYRNIYAATDRDDAGDAAYESVCRALAPIPVRRLSWPSGNDIGEAICTFAPGERAQALRTLIGRVR